MKLIKPSYTIESPINGEEILIAIEAAGRTAYKSEDKIEIEKIPFTDGVHSVVIGYNQKAISARPFIQRLIKNGHEAVLELGGMITIRFICDRGVSHEIVKHRLASFVQESTMFCNYANGKDIEFIIPLWCASLKEGVLEYLSMTPSTITDEELSWVNCMLDCESLYNNFVLNYKWSPQQARSVLPNSLKTEIVVGANIREWRHIFKLHTASDAHPQLRELMLPLLKEFKQKIPVIFDDILV